MHQISPKSDVFRCYDDLIIFKMAAVLYLEFLNFEVYVT